MSVGRRQMRMITRAWSESVSILRSVAEIPGCRNVSARVPNAWTAVSQSRIPANPSTRRETTEFVIAKTCLVTQCYGNWFTQRTRTPYERFPDFPCHISFKKFCFPSDRIGPC